MIFVVISAVKMLTAIGLFSMRAEGDVESLVIACMLVLSAQIDLVDSEKP